MLPISLEQIEAEMMTRRQIYSWLTPLRWRVLHSVVRLEEPGVCSVPRVVFYTVVQLVAEGDPPLIVEERVIEGVEWSRITAGAV
jgi:hypothetical protein